MAARPSSSPIRLYLRIGLWLVAFGAICGIASVTALTLTRQSIGIFCRLC